MITSGRKYFLSSSIPSNVAGGGRGAATTTVPFHADQSKTTSILVPVRLKHSRRLDTS